MDNKKELEPIKSGGLCWKIHVPNLLKEILINVNPKSQAALRVPIQQFCNQLYELAELSMEIDDPRLHLMMCRFTLYSCADPDAEDYNRDVFDILQKQVDGLKDGEYGKTAS